MKRGKWATVERETELFDVGEDGWPAGDAVDAVLSKLTDLNLTGTKVIKEGIAQLGSLLPHCAIAR